MQIYKIINNINGKSYIGQTKIKYTNRFKRHLHLASKKTNRYLYDAINLYGPESFSVELVEDIPNASREEGNDREIFWIKELNTLMPNGYNMTKGGDAADTLKGWTDEQKKRLWTQQAESRKKHPRTKDHNTKIGISNRAAWQGKTEEEKRRLSEQTREWALKNNIRPPDHTLWKKGCEGFFKNKHHTEKTKLKLAQCRLGKTYEEIMGGEVAARRKAQLSANYLGAKNPRFIDMPIDIKINIIKYIYENLNVKMENLSLIFHRSPTKIRQVLREGGIKNFQQFRNIKCDLQKKDLLNLAIKAILTNHEASLN